MRDCVWFRFLASALSRHPPRALLVLVALGILALGDTYLGRLQMALAARREDEAHQRVEALERTFRIAHPIYHHGLAPRHDGLTFWGPIQYRIRTNALGFRDAVTREVPARSNARRILLMGDSFTEGLGVNHESTFAGLLTARYAPAGIEVLNAGVQSYSPAIYWKKTEHLIRRQGWLPDAVIVFLDIGDIHDEAAHYRVDGAGRVVDAAEIPADAIHEWAHHSLIVRSVSKATQLIYPHPPWIGCGFIYDADCLGGWTLSRAMMDRFGRDGLARADAHMTRLAGLLRENQIPLAVVVYPWPSHLRWHDRSSLQLTYWRHWAARERAQFIELFTPFLAEADALGTRDAIAKDFIAGDVHWSAAGHRLVADNVQTRYVLPPPHPAPAVTGR